MQIFVIMGQTVVELFDSLAARTRCTHFCIYVCTEYLTAFCSRPEATSDVISGVAVEYVGMDVRMTCGDSRSNRSRITHFVMNDERRSSHKAERHWRFA